MSSVWKQHQIDVYIRRVNKYVEDGIIPEVRVWCRQYGVTCHQAPYPLWALPQHIDE
jgi:hypothetical protein